MKTSLCDEIINARFGNFHTGFEHRPANAQGGDETMEVVENGDGTWSVKSPDGTEWLSVQPDGTMEARLVADPSQPGLYEKFTRAGNVLTESEKDGMGDRALVQLIVRDDTGSSGGGSAPPNQRPGGFLHVSGLDFATEQGQPWLLAGFASYTIISEIQKGHDIGPFLDEGLSYGANTLLALGMDMGTWAHEHGFAVDPRDPNWPNWLASMFDQTAAKGMRCALGVFQQAQALSTSEKQQVWRTAMDVARGRWNVILRMGNESYANAWDPAELDAPSNMQGVLCSSGSRGINYEPVGPHFDFVEWEPPREPRARTFSDAGGAGFYIIDGYEGFPAQHKPLVCVEPPFFYESSHDWYGDFRWCSPADALTLGLNIGGNFAGGVFGSSQSLETMPSGPITADCARNFFRGLWAAFQRPGNVGVPSTVAKAAPYQPFDQPVTTPPDRRQTPPDRGPGRGHHGHRK